VSLRFALPLLPFAALVGAGLCAGCGIPYDTAGTYELVKEGKLRVGVAEKPPWANAAEGDMIGIEVELTKELAQRTSSETEWTARAESELVKRLRVGQLDLVIGGLTDDSPWSNEIAFSRPYLETIDPVSGETQKHVWAVRQGENRWLLEVDRFLQEQRAEARRLFKEAAP
jgi:ABC-type amino acid transport substrate-binding protein